MMLKGKPFRIAIINGPNINLLGNREVNHYGTEDLQSITNKLNTLARQLGVELAMYQSNNEGHIIDFIHEWGGKLDGIIINPAAFTNTSYGILEAITAFNIPFIEVHLSNIYARESWHAESIFSAKAIGSIIGFKGYVYELGLRGVLNYLANYHSNL